MMTEHTTDPTVLDPAPRGRAWRVAAPGNATRRAFMKGALLSACSAAAHPLMTTLTMAAAPWDHRLVVIILRGAMDGLDVVQPYGDPTLAALRPTLLKAGSGAAVLPGQGPFAGAHDLDGFFALHPALGGLLPLWGAGELAFAHAVSTPYRDKRSHFDGQDLLEAGTGGDVSPGAVRDGWLNRLLQTVPGITAETAFAIGAEDMLILSGPAPTTSWSPASGLLVSAQSRLLLEQVYHDDPLFRDAAAVAMSLASGMPGVGLASVAQAGDMDKMTDGAAMTGASGAGDPDPGMSDAKRLMESLKGGKQLVQPDRLAAYAAERLRAETRIAAFSIAGWDTHRDQAGTLPRVLEKLAGTILTLRDGLGPVWGSTTVLAMTEFGRTARENGAKGTDHGTGGAMLMAGGAVRGGRVLGRWPGLDEAALYDRRDLMPTGDVRAHAAWALRGLYGLDRALLERAVFPGLDMGSDPGLLR